VLAELEKARKLTAVSPKPGRKARTYGDPMMKLAFGADAT